MKTEKIIIFGDSISTTNFSRGGYQSSLLKNVGGRAVNYAQNYAALSEGYPYSAVDALKGVEGDVFADCVIFWAGTNDWAYNVPIDVFENSLKKVAKLAEEKYPYSSLVFCTPIYRFSPLADEEENKEAFNEKNRVGKTLEDYLKVIKENVPKEYLCDTSALCGINASNYTKYLRDGIHPSCEGYEVITNVLTNFINNL